jgi:hypothetical protein
MSERKRPWRVRFGVTWADKPQTWATYRTRQDAEAALSRPADHYFGVVEVWLQHYENGKWVEVPSHD